MAQSVEHVIGNDEVISSILITSSKKGIRKSECLFWCFTRVFFLTVRIGEGWNRKFCQNEGGRNAPALILVDLVGFEPMTSALRTQRSPN